MFPVSDGFNSITPEQLIELRKSLEFGSPTPATGGEGAGWPLVPQSIEAVLATATIQAKQIRFFQKIPKPDEMLRSGVHEYTRQVALGHDLEPFVTEGMLPTEHTSRYKREFVRVKYLATMRRVTDPMAAVATIGGADAITRESVNGTVDLLAKVERSLFHGDSDTNPAAYDGVVAAVSKAFPENVFDLEGKVLTVEYLQEITALMLRGPRYAYPEALWLAPSAQVSLAAAVGTQFAYMVDPRQQGLYAPTLGNIPRGFIGAHNQIVEYESDIFLEPEELGTEQSYGQPPLKTFTVTATAQNSMTGSKFYAEDAGVYRYAVAAYGPQGRSGVVKPQAVTVVAGGGVQLDIVGQGTEESDIIYYSIFRTKPGETKYYLIKRVPYQSTVTFADKNLDRAGCSVAVMLEYDPTVVQFRRLLPLLRLPLAKIDLSVRFAIAMFGMPIFETPTKIAVIKNIGT